MAIQYDLLAILIIFVAIVIFHQQIWDYIQRRKGQTDVQMASHGAEVHCPPNVTFTLDKIRPYKNDSKKFVIGGFDIKGKYHERTVNLLTNFKIYNIVDALLDKNETIFVCNIDENGKVWDNFLGVDFTDSAINKRMGAMEDYITSLEQTLEKISKSPSQSQAILAMAQLHGKVAKSMTVTYDRDKKGKKNQTVEIRNEGDTQDQEEEGE